MGEDVPSPSSVAAALEARAAALAQHQQRVEEAATHRMEPELEETGALHVVRGGVSAGAAATAEGAGAVWGGAGGQASGDQQQAGGGRGWGGGAGVAGGGYEGLEGFTPQWVLLESNEWRKRVQVGCLPVGMHVFVGRQLACLHCTWSVFEWVCAATYSAGMTALSMCALCPCACVHLQVGGCTYVCCEHALTSGTCTHVPRCAYLGDAHLLTPLCISLPSLDHG